MGQVITGATKVEMMKHVQLVASVAGPKLLRPSCVQICVSMVMKEENDVKRKRKNIPNLITSALALIDIQQQYLGFIYNRNVESILIYHHFQGLQHLPSTNIFANPKYPFRFYQIKQVYFLIKLFQQRMRSSFCLNSVSSPKQILNNPLNDSVSKQLYSFSRDSRFKDYRPYCDHLYNIPSHFRKSESALRSSKKKLDLTSTSLYQNGENNQRFDNRVLKIGPTFTMRQKLKVIDKTMSIEAQNEYPGAGRYENPEALSPKGNYFVSKHKKTSVNKFNPPSSIRFFQFQNITPGPGRYDELNNLNDSGKYSLSKTSGFGKRFFDKQHRVVKFQFKAKKNLNPGPGSYRFPSDFGNYDGDVYNQTGGISYLAPMSNRSSRKRF